MFYLILAIVAIAIWRWLSKPTKTVLTGTVNRLGTTTLMATNKAIDTVDDSLGLSEDYFNELVERYSSSQPSAKKR